MADGRFEVKYNEKICQYNVTMCEVGRDGISIGALVGALIALFIIFGGLWYMGCFDNKPRELLEERLSKP